MFCCAACMMPREMRSSGALGKALDVVDSVIAAVAPSIPIFISPSCVKTASASQEKQNY